jgi:phenylpyruvate tautomerase PptA (4-oxalocrotonate tautomerase family)
MPALKIELIAGRDKEFLLKLRDVVMDTVVQTLQLPPDDRNVRLIEYPSDLFQMKPPYEILIELSLFAGRTKETKKKLFQSIVNNLESHKLIGKNKVLIILNEQPMENWGIRGGISADELDLGFKINI